MADSLALPEPIKMDSNSVSVILPAECLNNFSLGKSFSSKSTFMLILFFRTKEEIELKKVKKHLCVIMPNKKAVKKTA
jgi:hypothetical protein